MCNEYNNILFSLSMNNKLFISYTGYYLLFLWWSCLQLFSFFQLVFKIILFNILFPTFWIHNLRLVSVKSLLVKNTVCCSCIVASWASRRRNNGFRETKAMIDRNFLYFLELWIIYITSNSWHYRCPRSVYCRSIVFLLVV